MKQLEPITKKIGDYTFYIRPFPAFTAANLSGDLASVLLPLLGGIAPLLNKSGTDNMMDIDAEEALPEVSKTLSSISGDKLEEMIRKLLTKYKNISVEGPETDSAELLTADLANEIFCGEIQDIFVLCYEVIKVNFSGFFKKFGVQFGSLIATITAKMMA